MNEIEVIGNLLEDPAIRYLKGHQPVTYLRLGTDYNAKNYVKYKKGYTVLPIISWDEQILRYYMKNNRCYIHGQIVDVVWEENPSQYEQVFEARLIFKIDRTYKPKWRQWDEQRSEK